MNYMLESAMACAGSYPSPEKERGVPSHLSQWARTLCLLPHASWALWKEGIKRTDHITSELGLTWFVASYGLSCPGVGCHRSPLDVAWCLINGIAELIKLIFLLSSVSQL